MTTFTMSLEKVEYTAFTMSPEKVECTARRQPRSGDRMQPTAQAVGGRREMCKPRRGERNQTDSQDMLRTYLCRLCLITRFCPKSQVLPQKDNSNGVYVP